MGTRCSTDRFVGCRSFPNHGEIRLAIIGRNWAMFPVPFLPKIAWSYILICCPSIIMLFLPPQVVIGTAKRNNSFPGVLR